MSTPAELVIDGLVERPQHLSAADFRQFPDEVRVADVSQFHPQRQGVAVTLESILQRVLPRPDADYLTLHATHDDFAASIPLEAVRGEGLVVYEHDGEPLPVERGGPFRFLIRDAAACHTDELDDCANVKFVDRIELTRGRGRDTRPETDEEHEHLHEQQS